MPSRRDFLRTVGAGASAALPQAAASPAEFPDRRALQAARARRGILSPAKTYRMMEWECHTPPEGTFDIDVEAALRAARDAGAESMMFYSQDHWGYAFYPSEVAVRHPHLPGDFFGREVDTARRLGMSVVCYYSLQFNNQCVLAHPDWGWVDEKGEQQRMRWFITCLDTPYRQYVLGMLDEILAVVRRRRPGVLVSLNGGPEAFPDDVMRKVSFIYAEPLTSSTGISLGSILMRGWGRPDYQAGVFSRQGYLDTYPGALPRVKADALILQNARVFIVGNAPVIGGLDGRGFSRRWFAVAKETWADVRHVDALLEGSEPLLSTAVLYSEATREELAGQKRPQDFRSSVLGALETMTYAGRPVESLPEFRLRPDQLRPFEVLVLPEVEVLSDAAAEVIRRWVADGGTLVASGACGLTGPPGRRRENFPLADVLGVDFAGEERRYAYDAEGRLKKGVVQTYLESSGHPLTRSLAESTVGLSGAFLKLRMRAGAQELLRYRLPLMVEDLPHHRWFNWGPPPPCAQSGGPAAVYHRFQKGQAVYLGAPVFQAVTADKLFWTRRWLPELVRGLAPRPLAELRFPVLAEHIHGTFFWDRGRRFVLVQILNAVELSTEGEFVDVPSAEIRLDPARLRVAAARVVWPSVRDLAAEHSAEITRILVPRPGRYTALYLKVA